MVSFLLVLEYRIPKEKIVFELEKKYCRQINSRGNWACQLTSRPTPVCQQQGWQTISFPRNIYYPFLLILKPDGSKVHNVSWTWTKKARQIVPGSLSSIMPCRTTIAYVLTTELTTMSIAPSWCAVTTVGQRRAIIVNQQKNSLARCIVNSPLKTTSIYWCFAFFRCYVYSGPPHLGHRSKEHLFVWSNRLRYSYVPLMKTSVSSDHWPHGDQQCSSASLSFLRDRQLCNSFSFVKVICAVTACLCKTAGSRAAHSAHRKTVFFFFRT